MVLPESTRSLAVLVSGGLDSAVLLGQAVHRHSAVHPLYIRTGLSWEGAEQNYLHRYLKQIAVAALRPLVNLDMPVCDLYGEHWSTQGTAPDANSPDEDCYLPGRNVLLLSKALIWCRLNNVPTVALAVLSANPFPDATPAFFRDYAAVVSRAVGGQIHVTTPFATMTKAEIIRRAGDLPLQHTLSCLTPISDRHCGACNKCAERARAFIAAGVSDPTYYVQRAWEGTTQRSSHTSPWE